MLFSAPSDLFLAGDDACGQGRGARPPVEAGWPSENVHDLGGIEAARGTEMWLPLWVRLMGPLGGPTFNLHLVRA